MRRPSPSGYVAG